MLNYLEEVITFGAVSKELTNNIKESRFSKGKSVHIVLMKKFPGMVNTKTSKDTSVNPEENIYGFYLVTKA
jgi:hypothetical protein